MEDVQSGSALGPALFIGLSVFALITQGEPDIDPDPATRIEKTAFVAPEGGNADAILAFAGWQSLPDASGMDRLSAILQPAPMSERGWATDATLPRPDVLVLLRDLTARAAGDRVQNEGSRPDQALGQTPQARQPPKPAPDGFANMAALARIPQTPDAQDTTPTVSPRPPRTASGWQSSRPDAAVLRRAIRVLAPSPANPRAWKPARPVWFRVIGDHVFLRPDPAMASAPIGQYDSGVFATVQGASGSWLLITIGGQTGWMFRRYLLPVATE